MGSSRKQGAMNRVLVSLIIVVFMYGVAETANVDGEWSNWQPASGCSATCGGGEQTERRSCSNPPPQGNGTQCVGATNRTVACNENFCPIDGNWTAWTQWTDCSVRCRTGSRDRQRSCTNPPPQYFGQNCVGNKTDTDVCYIECPIITVEATDGTTSQMDIPDDFLLTELKAVYPSAKTLSYLDDGESGLSNLIAIKDGIVQVPPEFWNKTGRKFRPVTAIIEMNVETKTQIAITGVLKFSDLSNEYQHIKGPISGLTYTDLHSEVVKIVRRSGDDFREPPSGWEKAGRVYSLEYESWANPAYYIVPIVLTLPVIIAIYASVKACVYIRNKKRTKKLALEEAQRKERENQYQRPKTTKPKTSHGARPKTTSRPVTTKSRPTTTKSRPGTTKTGHERSHTRPDTAVRFKEPSDPEVRKVLHQRPSPRPPSTANGLNVFQTDTESDRPMSSRPISSRGASRMGDPSEGLVLKRPMSVINREDPVLSTDAEEPEQTIYVPES